MGVDFKSLNNVLKHPLRRRIVIALSQKESISYVDLMNLVEATNTGKFNYHLKILGDLIEKNQDGRYVLTEKGRLTAQFLEKFPEKDRNQPTILGVADAALIGFAGTVLTVANPGFWSLVLAALLKAELDIPVFAGFGTLIFVYALMVPGSAMWIFTVRRSHSHDAYDLLKPPVASLILLAALLIVMFLLKATVTVTVTGPPTPTPEGGTSYSMMRTNLATVLVAGMMLSFLGVLIAEAADRTRKRAMS